MLSGDDLTIALFLVGTSITLGAAAMSAAGWRHPFLIFGLFALSAAFSILGVGWPFFKTLSPPTTALVDQVATHPVAWFVVLILGIMSSLLYKIPSLPSARVVLQPKHRQWSTSLSIVGLCDGQLFATANADKETLTKLETEDRRLRVELAELRIKSDPLSDQDTQTFEAARNRAGDLFWSVEMARMNCNESFIAATDDIYYKLRTGQLVAKGFLMPIDTNSEEVMIAPSRWRFLKFNEDFTEASGEGITYKAVAVTRA